MPSRDPALLLDQQLCFAMYRASRALIRAYGPLLEPLGVTYPQYLALLTLWEEDAVSVKRLGERLSLDSATLTPLLKRLEQRGLIERRRDATDERVVRVLLSKKGHALQARAKNIPNAVACRVVDARDRGALARIGQLREQLQALATRLEAGAEDVA
jgi:DNA-binding MarR family transcriptional regulator